MTQTFKSNRRLGITRLAAGATTINWIAPAAGTIREEGEMDAIIEVLAVVIIFGGLFAAFHKHVTEG